MWKGKNWDSDSVCLLDPPSPPSTHAESRVKKKRTKKNLDSGKWYHRKLQQHTGTHWCKKLWQCFRMLQHSRDRRGSAELEKERDECSSILRSEGKSPLVLVLLERLALTHEYFILLMFKSHHLWCGAWACEETHSNEEEKECVCGWERQRMCWSIMHSFSKFTCDMIYCICISVLWKKWTCLCVL